VFCLRHHCYLGIGADGCFAVLAGVGEERLVALDAEWLLVAQNVAVTGQVEVAVEAGEHRCIRPFHHVADLRLQSPMFDVDLQSPLRPPHLLLCAATDVKHAAYEINPNTISLLSTAKQINVGGRNISEIAPRAATDHA